MADWKQTFAFEEIAPGGGQVVIAPEPGRYLCSGAPLGGVGTFTRAGTASQIDLVFAKTGAHWNCRFKQ